jgi:hypothetical protein
MPVDMVSRKSVERQQVAKQRHTIAKDAGPRNRRPTPQKVAKQRHTKCHPNARRRITKQFPIQKRILDHMQLCVFPRSLNIHLETIFFDDVRADFQYTALHCLPLTG